MDLPGGIEEAVSLAERRWPSLTFHITGDEASSACPFEHEGEDRFHVFSDGGFWCRVCAKTGWLDDDQQRHILTPAERNALEIRKLARQVVAHEKRLTALEIMARSTDHLVYHKALDSDGYRYWESQGITRESVDSYLLGICYNCPTDSEHRVSWTIPIFAKGVLVNIRHRLMAADNGDKYRPHMAGLGTTLFDSSHLDNGLPTVILAEGEKKTIVLNERGFNAVGILGKSSFPPSWAKRFTQFERVFVCLDPDATDRAIKIAALFDGRGYVVRLPEKCDDFLVNGGTATQLREFIRLARRID